MSIDTETTDQYRLDEIVLVKKGRWPSCTHCWGGFMLLVHYYEWDGEKNQYSDDFDKSYICDSCGRWDEPFWDRIEHSTLPVDQSGVDTIFNLRTQVEQHRVLVELGRGYRKDGEPAYGDYEFWFDRSEDGLQLGHSLGEKAITEEHAKAIALRALVNAAKTAEEQL